MKTQQKEETYVPIFLMNIDPIISNNILNQIQEHIKEAGIIRQQLRVLTALPEDPSSYSSTQIATWPPGGPAHTWQTQIHMYTYLKMFLKEHCGDLNKLGPHGLLCLNAWSPDSRTVWQGFGGVDLLDEVFY